MRPVWRWTLLLTPVFLLCVYRAVTQSITIDEAFSYNDYIRPGWKGIFQPEFYSANNHILFSALAKVSTDFFGLSEWSLRLPALAGTALFLSSLARVSLHVTTAAWARGALLFLTACNPLTLDFLVAARGYALALGCFTWALAEILDGREASGRAPLVRAGVAVGLCVAANLAFAISAIALFVVAGLLLLLGRQLRLLPWLVLPGLLTAAAFLLPGLWNAQRDQFYFGCETILDSVETIVEPMLVHNQLARGPFGDWGWLYKFRNWALPVLMAGLVLWWVWRLLKREGAAWNLLFGVLAVSLLGWWLARMVTGMLYPRERLGLSLVLLFFVCWASATEVWWRSRWMRPVSAASLALLLAAAVQMGTQFNATYFAGWYGETHLREAISRVRDRAGRVSAHWSYKQSIEFYRAAWKLDWQPLEHFDSPPLEGYDVYILETKQGAAAQAQGLRVVFRDDATGLLAAVKP
jgi:hypothetical protein